MTERLRIEKRLCLNLINKIEDITGKMFHEYMPELDQEINTTEDIDRLRSIRIALAQHHDELTMD